MSITFNGTQVETITFNNTNIDVVFCNGVLIYGMPDYLYFENPSTTDTIDIQFATTSSGWTDPPTLEYSTDRSTWTTYTLNTNITVQPQQKCYWRGDNTTFSKNMITYIKFVSTGTVKAGGNIMSLVDKTCMSKTLASGVLFHGLFYNNTYLVTPPKLPATTLYGLSIGNGCYRNMFYGCTALTTAPALPATTLAHFCYYSMFYGCTSLTTIPSLPATAISQGAYASIFNGCTNIMVSNAQDETYQYPFMKFDSVTSFMDTANMFANTGGTFKGIPTAGVQYYTANQVIS